ncbi:MAG: hydroxymethylglutaryl-CoA lyase [Candidatus Dormibacteria bacterium]
MKTRVLWTDVAPRDGLQNVSERISTSAKVRLVRDLLDAGMPRVEATSFVSPAWVPQLGDAAEVLEALGPEVLPRLRVLIPNRRGLELALAHRVSNVLVTIGATDSFNRRNVNRDIASSLADLEAIVADAAGAGCQVDVAVSVAFGCPFEGRVDPERVVHLASELVARGVEEVSVADTIGVAGPAEVRDLVGRCRPVVPGDRLSLHVHDTRGQGVANVVSAYGAGVTRFDGSVGGVGGCPFAPRSTGNVCTEDALLALHDLGAESGCDLSRLAEAATRLGGELGRELPGRLHRAGVWSGLATEQAAGT